MENVTVIGLGEMGAALASAFLDGGHRVTVWNRTPAKAEPLTAKGAELAADVRTAVAASTLIVVSVKGNANARALLESSGDALAGRSVVNLTDGTSAEARDVASAVTEAGADYLHGQIMTIAPGVGHPDAVLFFGGSATLHERHEAALALLAGRGPLISDDPGAPTLYGMAVHDIMWGALNGFLHASALLTDAGIPAERFVERADPSLSALMSHLPFLAGEVDRAEYAIPFGALQHHLPSAEDLVRESQDRGIDAEFPAYTRDLVRTAIDAGHATDSYSRLVEHFREG